MRLAAALLMVAVVAGGLLPAAGALLVRESARFALRDGGEIVLRLAGRNRLVGASWMTAPCCRRHAELIRSR